jgi:glucose/arabinose dehydrogenase
MRNVSSWLKSIFLLLLLVFVFNYGSESIKAAASLPEGFQLKTEVAGLNIATTFAFADSSEVFFAEKGGKVVRAVNGELVNTPVFQLNDINDYWDRGLLGMALDPDFKNNGYIYLSYTYENSPDVYDGPKTARIVRVTYSHSTGVADPNSLVVLVGSVGGNSSTPSCSDYPKGTDCIPSNSASHSAGGLRFGPDGYLYATLGDGAAFTDVDPNAYDAQDLDTLTGKLLRINTDGTAPSDNPFYDGNPNSNQSKIFAYGIRNSYRFNFEPASGQLYAGEVGWYLSEEINLINAGDNLGWPCREGFIKHPRYNCSAQNYIDPIYAYGHTNDESNSITGGAFATSADYGAYTGSYFFGDYSQDFIKRAEIQGGDIQVFDFGQGVGGPVDIQTGPDGYIYYLSIYTGELRKLVLNNDNQAPLAEITPLVYPNTAAPAQSTFTAENSTDPDGDSLSYVWNFGDGQTAEGMLVNHTYQTEGAYTVNLEVTDTFGAKDSVSINVTVGEVATSANPTHVSTVHTPIPTFLGRPVTTTTQISNSGSNEEFIIYWEVRNEAGQRVHLDFIENAVIETNQSADYSFTWLPPVPGNYRVDVGLFSNDWRKTYQWNQGVDNISVVDRVAEQINLTLTNSFGASNVTLGNTHQVGLNIKNNGLAGNGIVYVEFYSQQNVRESYQFSLEQFGDNASKDIVFNWTPQQEGVYRVAVGLFSEDWTTPFENFNPNVTQVAVTTGATQEPFSLQLINAAVNSISLGNPATLTLDIANLGVSGQGIVYVELYDENNNRVDYQFDQSTYVANQQNSLNFSFTPQAAGQYSFAIGLFDPTWITSYEPFRFGAANFTVSP